MSTKYTYSIENDTANGEVNLDSLTNEINVSSIITALDYCDSVLDVLDVYFKSELSTEDETTLNSIVSAHTGEAPSYTAEVLVSNRVEARTVNCASGRHLHSRYVTFQTSDQDNYDNTDWQENDYGDITYIMKDSNGDTTTTNSECKETWIAFEPTFDYEISGGSIFVPDTLAGGDDNAWEIHVVAIPDLTEEQGGNVHFIANPRIKWVKGDWLTVDSSVNPAELSYDATYHTNKILFVIKHPVAAQTEFQIQLKLYK